MCVIIVQEGCPMNGSVYEDCSELVVNDNEQLQTPGDTQPIVTAVEPIKDSGVQHSSEYMVASISTMEASASIATNGFQFHGMLKSLDS